MLSVPYKESPVLTSGPGLFDSGGVRRLSVDEMRARWNIRSHAILMQVNDRIRPDLLDLVADTQAYAFCYLVSPDRGKGDVIACVVSSDASSNSRVTVKLRWTDLMPPWGGQVMESPVDMVEVAEEIRAQAYADALKGIPTDALLEEIRRRCEQVKHLSEVML